jgi:DNA polymerase-3 subunit epsilon
MKLFFDTETTGKADFRAAPDAAHQPHVVQLAALLTEDDGEERGCFNAIITPSGYNIPREAASIHGITTDIANACGLPLVSALSTFSMMCARADTLVAHNIDFDFLVMKCAYLRIGKPDRMADLAAFCTMRAATDICQLPGPYGFKWPKLTEAHLHLCGSELEGAHDALADVRGCARVFFALQSISK